MNRPSNGSEVKHFKFKFWLQRKLSRKVKRYFFLTSLWSYFQIDSSYDRSALAKLNEVMLLSDNSESLLIPAMLARVIWGEPLKSLVKDRPQKDKLCFVKAIDHAPFWLMYDKREKIREDVEKLISTLS